MVKYPRDIKEEERQLLLTISEIQYGEIVDIEITKQDQPATIRAQLSEARMSLINAIRDGATQFVTLKVHQGEPAYGTSEYTNKYGYKVRKLFKFG
jgi:hypothetical protein